MTPLERAARALAEHRNPYAADHPKRATWWADQSDRLRRDYLDQARAVLTAIREPSERMIDRGAEQDANEHGCVAIWQAMIDALLAEEG